MAQHTEAKPTAKVGSQASEKILDLVFFILTLALVVGIALYLGVHYHD
jgi:hypothetical protein